MIYINLCNLNIYQIMELKYHTSADFFYDKNGDLYSNPNESLEGLEKMYC